MDENPSGKVVGALVPLAEMFGYSTNVRSISQGRASFSMEFEKYAECPSFVQEKVIKERQEKLKEKEG